MILKAYVDLESNQLPKIKIAESFYRRQKKKRRQTRLARKGERGSAPSKTRQTAAPPPETKNRTRGSERRGRAEKLEMSRDENHINQDCSPDILIKAKQSYKKRKVGRITARQPKKTRHSQGGQNDSKLGSRWGCYESE